MIKILQGNCLDKIQELNDNSIDCVVTSPPYFGLRDYGVDGQFGLEKTYQDYLTNTVKVFETFKPKLKDTATIWWNVGDSYSNHKDCKSIGQTLTKGTSREKAHVIEKGKSHTRDSKLLKASGLKDKDLMMIPNRVAIALQDAGWYIRSEIIWHKPNPMPESVKDRPTSCHEKIWLITKNKKYYYDADAIKEKGVIPKGTKGAKGSKERLNVKGVNSRPNEYKIYNGKRNKRNVWTITTKPFKDAHFATFPKDLIEPCIKAGCPEGGTVLDPFGGAGTTGLVASELNRSCIMIELNPEYISIMKKRLEKNKNLFNQMAPGIGLEPTTP